MSRQTPKYLYVAVNYQLWQVIMPFQTRITKAEPPHLSYVRAIKREWRP